MTGMERLQKLMAGQKPDRVPINVNLLDQGSREVGLSPRDYFSRGELVAEGQLRLREKYGYDTLLGMFYSALDAELLGCRNLIFADDGPPNVGHLVIRTPEDIKQLTLPDDLSAHPRFRELANCISILKRESQGRWPVLGELTASFSLPAMLMGVGGWLELLLNGDPDLRELLLERCSQLAGRKIQALKEAGADLIVYNNPLASTTFITPEMFRQQALSWTQKDLELSGPEGIVFFNGGGRINPILADLNEHTGISAYHLNPFDDILEARRILGPQPLIIGSINDIRLLDWTPAEVEQEVARIMQAGQQAGGFIFGTLLMPFHIPEENIRALVNAAVRYGKNTATEAKALISCGILEKEIRFLAEKNGWQQKLVFLPSGLHVDFNKLQKGLEACLQNQQGTPATVFYGTCHPCIDQILEDAHACRTPGQNCVDIYLGHERFCHELEQGAFFLFEDWALHWREIVGSIMPGDPEIMRSIFRSAHKYLLAIRTPCSGDFRREAEAVSDMTSLELRWVDVGLEHLEANLARMFGQEGEVPVNES